MDSSDRLLPLLDYLSRGDVDAETQWRDWRITRVTGGWNNLLCRATNAEGDRPAEWQSDFQAKSDHYLTLAHSKI